MAQFDPATARVTSFYQRRRIGPGEMFLYEPLKFRLIRYDVDVAGEPTTYIEPLSESRYVSDGGALTSVDFGVESAVENVRVVDSIPYADVTSFS